LRSLLVDYLGLLLLHNDWLLLGNEILASNDRLLSLIVIRRLNYNLLILNNRHLLRNHEWHLMHAYNGIGHLVCYSSVVIESD
jgi:hypothetical protein